MVFSLTVCRFSLTFTFPLSVLTPPQVFPREARLYTGLTRRAPLHACCIHACNSVPCLRAPHCSAKLMRPPPGGRYDSLMTLAPKQHTHNPEPVPFGKVAHSFCSISARKCSHRRTSAVVTVKEGNAKRQSDIYSREAGAWGNQLLGQNGFLLLLLWPLKSAEAPRT